ncbi:hypothetical protein [Oleidesulfovibrio sp.]|uniref:hypothetical protein n=1 Tax=Oleidesulfovibrio sp. TaxID=2909707 RepID=UPI003A870B14
MTNYSDQQNMSVPLEPHGTGEAMTAPVVAPAPNRSTVYAFLGGCLAGAAAVVTAAIMLDDEPASCHTDAEESDANESGANELKADLSVNLSSDPALATSE